MENVFCQNSEWDLKLAVETDQHKRVSIHTGARTLTSDHIRPVRVKVGHSNPNPNFNADPNHNPRDCRGGNCPDSMHTSRQFALNVIRIRKK